MIVYEKEERPFVETPDPRLGVILSRLNEMSLAIESDINTDHNLAKEELSKITGLLGAYSTELRNLVTTHINKRGAVHNEDKGDVGLPDVDNYRKASKNEVLEGSDVDAWITVGDAKAKVEQTNKDRLGGDFQKNIKVNFSSFFTPNKYPTKLINGVGDEVFIGLHDPEVGLEEVSLLSTDDRIIYSTLTSKEYGGSPNKTNPGNRTFISSGITDTGGFTLSERPDIDVDEIVTYGLNSEIGKTKTTDSSKKPELVVLRRTSKVVEISKFPDISTNPEDSISFAELRSKTNSVLVGLMCEVGKVKGSTTFGEVFGTRFPIVRTNALNNVLEIVPNLFMVFNIINQDKVTLTPNEQLKRTLSQYISLSSGQRAVIDESIFKIKTTSFWVAQGKSLLSCITIPVRITEGSRSEVFKLSVIDQVSVPVEGVGDKITITSFGSGEKSVVLPGLKLKTETGFLTKRDPNNALDLSYGSGVLTNGGYLIKAVKTPQAFHLKRFYLNGMGLKEVVESQLTGGRLPTNKGVLYSHTIDTPGISKPVLPVDLIDCGSKGFLVKGHNPRTSNQSWFKNKVNNGMINDLGVIDIKLNNVPSELISYSYKEPSSGKLEKGLSGMIFQPSNGFVGFENISFDGSDFSRTNPVKLSNKTSSWFNARQLELRNSAKGKGLGDIETTGFIAELPIYDNNKGTLQKGLLIVNSMFKQDGEPQALLSTSYRITQGILEFTGLERLTDHPVKSGQPVLKTSSNKHNDPERYSVKSDSGDELDSNGLKSKSKILDNDDVRFEFYGIGGSFSSILRVDINPTTMKITNLKVMSEPDYYFRDSNINVRGVYDLSREGGFNNSLGVINTVGIKGQDFVLPTNTEFVMEGRPYRLETQLSIPFTEVSKNRSDEGVSYIYLMLVGNGFELKSFKQMREPDNNELLVATYGLNKLSSYTYETDYILIDKNLISPIRKGSAAAAFDQDNVNRFFKIKDIVDL